MSTNITEADIRVLALLYWQTQFYCRSDIFVPISVDMHEEARELGASIQRLHSHELIDAMQVVEGPYKGLPVPVPNAKGCEILDTHRAISDMAQKEFVSMFERQNAPQPAPAPRKKKKRRVS